MEKTDVDAAADLSRSYISVRSVLFDLSKVLLDDVLIEGGFAANTAFIRIPLSEPLARFAAKSGYGNEMPTDGDASRPTIVVRSRDAADVLRLLSETVRTCQN